MKDAREYTNYKNTINRRPLILLATVGSAMLGMNNPEESDIDEMGIALERPEDLLGFAPFEHDVYRTAEEREGNSRAPSGPGDIDLTIYGLRKFVRLSLAGNPNLISLLYLPKDRCSVYTPYAAELQELAPTFVSKRVADAFLGYLQAQRLRLQGGRGGMDVNRRDLVERYGFDTKYAMHMLRLGIQGLQFVTDRKLTFPMASDNRSFLRNVREGEYNLDRVLRDANYYEIEIQNAMDPLPESPDYKQIEQWLLSVYRREWYENQKAQQQ